MIAKESVIFDIQKNLVLKSLFIGEYLSKN